MAPPQRHGRKYTGTEILCGQRFQRTPPPPGKAPVKAISNQTARRIALAAQGFDTRHRATKPTWSAIARTIERIQLLQIDSVNVLVRSHYLPLFARLGNYDRAALDRRSLETKNRHLFECWAHEASLVPLSLHHLMRWRMHRARNGDGIYTQMDRFAAEEPDFLKQTLAHVERQGPTRVRDIPDSGKGQVAGGVGAKASWRWRRCSTRASSPPPNVMASNASTTFPNASFPPTFSPAKPHLSEKSSAN